jgi:NAD(P)-dependent dehydrogenase (short-subunit alcohol dehydrogenase family)
MKDKVVIVTGASSGIGRATAIEFARQGARVVMAARSETELKNVQEKITAQGGACISVVTDVTVESSCKNLIDTCVKTYGGIDVLINNAGISIRAILEDMSLETFRKVMDVNFWGAVMCTKFALPYLLKSKGSVVGVSSIAGYVGLPARTAYSASKSGLQGFLEALRTENRNTGLHVLVACPGYTESNIRKKALNAKGESQGESPLNEGSIMPASEVAKRLIRAVEKRKRRLTLTTEGKLAVHTAKFFPSFVEGLVFKRVTSEPGSPIRLK